ncbi:GNAT family N-acetyltransferase [Elongatibacter sediminis]|uniref:GNAT family N-acetyltransferase n=1 Tax=Elongatibacter sediminis TaxID=3119006 RepID=A0AAW9RBJ5_9GAMM
MTSIRRATAEDAAVVLELIEELAEHHGQAEHVRTDEDSLVAAGFGDDPGVGALIAEVDGIVAGFLSYTVCYSIWSAADFMLIDDVYVRNDFRGDGLGEALMRELQQTCKALGLSRIKWEVEPDNAAAIRFYERLGATGYDKRLFRWNVE